MHARDSHHFENENTFWKWKHILKTKAHSKNHFENENTFLEKWKLIHSFLILQGAEVPFYIWYDDYPEHASQEYKGRVSKVPLDGQGQSGLASLILSEVKDTDRGWYNCKVLFLNREPNNAVVSA